MNAIRSGRELLDERPEKNLIWAAVEVFAEHLDIPDHRPDHPERELWYVPTVSIWDAHRADALFQQFDIERVCDLGAGDCRFALWCDRRGYDVVAYELNTDLANAVRSRFDLGGVDLRCRDYHGDFDALTGSETAVVCFGGTNELPRTPKTGIAIEGYSETGVTAWHGGEVVAAW